MVAEGGRDLPGLLAPSQRTVSWESESVGSMMRASIGRGALVAGEADARSQIPWICAGASPGDRGARDGWKWDGRTF